MDVALSEVEVACLKKLAELSQKGEEGWDKEAGWESIGLTAENYMPVLSLLEQLGYVTNALHTSETHFDLFAINPSVILAVRAIEAEEKKKQEAPDIVETFKATLKKHPVGGRIAVLVIGSLFVIAAANQIMDFAEKLGKLRTQPTTAAPAPVAQPASEQSAPRTASTLVSTRKTP